MGGKKEKEEKEQIKTHSKQPQAPPRLQTGVGTPPPWCGNHDLGRKNQRAFKSLPHGEGRSPFGTSSASFWLAGNSWPGGQVRATDSWVPLQGRFGSGCAQADLEGGGNSDLKGQGLVTTSAQPGPAASWKF